MAMSADVTTRPRTLYEPIYRLLKRCHKGCLGCLTPMYSAFCGSATCRQLPAAAGSLHGTEHVYARHHSAQAAAGIW